MSQAFRRPPRTAVTAIYQFGRFELRTATRQLLVDPRLGEKNCLCAIVKPDATLTLDEVVAFSEGPCGGLQAAGGARRDERLSHDADGEDTAARASEAGIGKGIG